MSDFSRRLAKLIKSSGKTLNQLSDDLGVNKSTLSRYKNGKNEPKENFIKKAARYFNVSTDYLLGNSELKNDPHEKIKQAIEDDPELLNFWDELSDRDDLKLLFKQTRNLDKEAIQDVISIIKRIENSKN